jgi:hypothetical protein
MMHDGVRTKSGTMPSGLQEEVDRLLDEFMTQVDAISEDRHLQKGIARSQLPCSGLAALDRDNLYIVAQIRSENRFSVYVYDPNASWTPQKVLNSAQWEFGIADPFLIKFPAELVAESADQRLDALKKIASKHIDSEFTRFVDLLSLLRTRPIFGSAPNIGNNWTALLLLPSNEISKQRSKVITEVAFANKLTLLQPDDVLKGKLAVREMWLSINEARVVIADITGPDPGVMYSLGIAHTIGKETILISPLGSEYLADIPKIHRIEYDDSDSGMMQLKQELSNMLIDLLATMDV